MPVPKEVLSLIKRFQQNRDAYLSSQYNEAQLRREFIDPFFTALGWDVANVAGYAEAYKDVIHEDAIKIGSATKAPDYCFRIGGIRKFFVEAKRPSIKIKDDASSAYQLRRYAWSAKLPLSILTTFAEFSVYDCRVKPDKKDPASTARVLYITAEEYESRWDELAGIFAKEAVLKGSFDRFAESTKLKRGTAEVDAAFLKEIEKWREELARNIALRSLKRGGSTIGFCGSMDWRRGCSSWGRELVARPEMLPQKRPSSERARHLSGSSSRCPPGWCRLWGVAQSSRRDTLEGMVRCPVVDPMIRVGVDVGGKIHRVGIAGPDGKLLEEFTIPHSQKGFQEFFTRVERHRRNRNLPVAVAMEGYNGHARPLDRLVREKGYKLYSVNNLKLGSGRSSLAKTGSPDVRRILELFHLKDHLPLAKDMLQEIPKVPPVNEKLKRLTRRRRQLIDEKVGVVNAGRPPSVCLPCP